jgi:hypothetical protein
LPRKCGVSSFAIGVAPGKKLVVAVMAREIWSRHEMLYMGPNGTRVSSVSLVKLPPGRG